MSYGYRGYGARYAGAAAAAAAEAAPFIRNHQNTTVTYDALNDEYTVAKTGGVDGTQDASAVSDIGFTGDFILRLTPSATAVNGGVGVNTDPLTNTLRSSVDYAIDFNGATDAWAFGSGASLQWMQSYAGGENWFIKRVGTDLIFGKGGTDGVTGFTQKHLIAGVAGTLYVDTYQNKLNGPTFKIKRVA